MDLGKSTRRRSTVHLFSSYITELSFDDITLPDVDIAKLPFPWVDSPFFESLIKGKPLSQAEQSLVRQYREDGYVIIDQNAIEQSLTDRINTDMQDRMDRDTGRLQDAWRRSESVRELACHEAITSVPQAPLRACTDSLSDPQFCQRAQSKQPIRTPSILIPCPMDLWLPPGWPRRYNDQAGATALLPEESQAQRLRLL